MRPLQLLCYSPATSSPPLTFTSLQKKVVSIALSTTLSFGFLVAPPPPSLALNQPAPVAVENCRVTEEEKDTRVNVTDKGLVEEAWEIVADSFLDSRHNRWSPESWLQKKEDILSTSIQTRSKAHDIIKRMLASLGDPYTRFLSPSEFSKMARYDMTGIGINLREIPDDIGGVKLKVLGLILDGPAHTAGVRQGDEVLAVNGVDVGGKSAFEVSSMLQGPTETFVTIKVKHGNCGPVQSVNVQRQLVARTPVLYRLEEMGTNGSSVGYVRLKEFNALARKDLLIAMRRLKDMGASSFILDLRDNRGGLVQEGIEISKLFLEEGETIISTVGQDPQYQNSIVAETVPVITDPVIILVNQNTASASEIVASALHDNCKAVLVGDRTFGKGLIQSVFELHDGSGVVVTVGKYVTPKHVDINGHGIDPDFQNLPAWSEVRKQLSKCHAQQHG